MALSANEILGVNDCTLKEIAVPEWGEGATVFIRIMDGQARAAIEAEWRKPQPNKLRGLTAVYSLSDKDGNLLFKPDQCDFLQKKSYAALDRISEAALSFNEITKDSLELLKKTLEAITSKTSPIDSQAT